MLIKKIIIQNIFAYNGCSEIDFTTNTSLHGENGFGKTSLINIIKFLFGKNFKNDELININSIDESFAEIHLNKDNNNIIIRKDVLKSVIKTKVLIDDITYEEAMAEDFIETIIDKNLIDYIFFDGEKVNDEDYMNSLEVTNQIDSFYDLDLFKTMINDSKTVIHKIKVDNIDKKELHKFKLIEKENESILEEIVSISQEKKELNKLLEKSYKRKESILNNSNLQQKQIDILFNDLDNFKTLYQKEYLDVLLNHLLNDLPFYFNDNLSKLSIESSFNVIDSKKFDHLINEIITKNNVSFDLKNLLLTLNKETLNSSSNINDLIKLLDIGTNKFNELNEKIKNYNDFKKEIYNNSSNGVELIQIEDKIEELENSLNFINEKLNNYENKIEENKYLLSELFNNDKQSESVINALNKLHLIIDEAEIQYLNRSFKQVSEINKLILENIHLKDFMEIHKISKINFCLDEKGNKNIKIIAGNKELKVNRLSAGQKHMLSFLLLLLFMQNKKSDFIVVDTPFGRLDNNNQNKIKDLYKIFEQNILLVTSSELNLVDNNYQRYEILKENLGSKIVKVKK